MVDRFSLLGQQVDVIRQCVNVEESRNSTRHSSIHTLLSSLVSRFSNAHSMSIVLF